MARITLHRVDIKRGDGEGEYVMADVGKVQLRTEDIREVYEGGLWRYGDFIGNCTYVRLELEPGAESPRQHTVREDFNTVTAMIDTAEAEEGHVRKSRKQPVLRIPKS